MSQLLDSAAASQLERMPPHSIEAEMCLLAAMMLDKDVVGQSISLIDRDAFFQPDHQIIYDVLIKLFEQNRPITAVMAREELNKKQLLEESAAQPTWRRSSTAYPTPLRACITPRSSAKNTCCGS